MLSMFLAILAEGQVDYRDDQDVDRRFAEKNVSSLVQPMAAAAAVSAQTHQLRPTRIRHLLGRIWCTTSLGCCTRSSAL